MQKADILFYPHQLWNSTFCPPFEWLADQWTSSPQKQRGRRQEDLFSRCRILVYFDLSEDLFFFFLTVLVLYYYLQESFFQKWGIIKAVKISPLQHTSHFNSQHFNSQHVFRFLANWMCYIPEWPSFSGITRWSFRRIIFWGNCYRIWTAFSGQIWRK